MIKTRIGFDSYYWITKHGRGKIIFYSLITTDSHLLFYCKLYILQNKNALLIESQGILILFTYQFLIAIAAMWSAGEVYPPLKAMAYKSATQGTMP